jgi:hypothetical protein
MVIINTAIVQLTPAYAQSKFDDVKHFESALAMASALSDTEPSLQLL